MALFFADENFPFPVVEALRGLGHDVLTLQETGRAGQAVSDEAVLSLATSAERAVLTMNRKHFIQLHGKIRDHGGIIACTIDTDFQDQAERIHAAVASVSLSDRLIRVNRRNPQR